MTFETFIKVLRFDIIGLNRALAYFIGAEKIETSSLTSHIRQKLLK